MTCDHATIDGNKVHCRLVPLAVTLSLRVCDQCQSQWKDGVQPTPASLTPILEVYQPSRGLGDTIAKATAAVGIVPCGGCKERQQRLNELVPYRKNSRTS